MLLGRIKGSLIGKETEGKGETQVACLWLQKLE